MTKNNFIIYLIIFASGFVIAYFITPTKTITEKVEVQSEVDKKTIADLNSQINTLEKINKTIKERVRTVIITTPDGTKKEEIIRDTDTSEQTEREIKAVYEAKIKMLEEEISELKNKTVTEINKKSFGVEVGYDVSRSGYGHITYDLFSSLFIGGHITIGNNNTLGAGVGIRL